MNRPYKKFRISELRPETLQILTAEVGYRMEDVKNYINLSEAGSLLALPTDSPMSKKNIQSVTPSSPKKYFTKPSNSILLDRKMARMESQQFCSDWEQA